MNEVIKTPNYIRRHHRGLYKKKIKTHTNQFNDNAHGTVQYS